MAPADVHHQIGSRLVRLDPWGRQLVGDHMVNADWVSALQNGTLELRYESGRSWPVKPFSCNNHVARIL